MSNVPPTARPPAPAPKGPEGPAPEEARAASRKTLNFAVLILAAVVTAGLHLPWKVASLVFGVLALVFGVRALIAVVRARIAGGMIVFVSLGIVVATLTTFSQITSIALWPIQSNYESCLSSALTDEARAQCQTGYQKDIEHLMPSLPPTMTPSR